jgi:biopolymer transport protein ExbD
MLKLTHDDDADPQLNLTPIIDCMVFLLIFFLCTLNLKKPEKLLPVTLPFAGHAKDAKLQGEVITTITKDGERYISDRKTYHNQAPVPRADFIAYLNQLSQTTPTPPIRVDIDSAAQYSHVMEVIDSLELYGLNKIYMRSSHGSRDEHEEKSN